jgi:hypothetical protein
MAPTLFLARSLSFVWGWPPTYASCITGITGVSSCLACWLKWGLTTCLHRLALSHPPDLHLLSSWDYRHEPSSPALSAKALGSIPSTTKQNRVVLYNRKKLGLSELHDSHQQGTLATCMKEPSPHFTELLRGD